MSARQSIYKVIAGISSFLILIPLASCGSSTKNNNGSVSIACSQQDDFCEVMTRAFTKKTGIKTSYVRLGSGEILARLATNPGEFDVWAGGQSENHLLADDKGWIEHYASSSAKGYPAKYKDPNNAWTGFYTDSVAFCSSAPELKKKGLKAPTSWNDLLNPKLKNSVGMMHPATAGAGYNAIYTQVMIDGGDKAKAIDYFKQLNTNIMQYSKAAATGTEQAGRGEVTVSIALDSDCVKAYQGGYKDLKLSYPKEGAGYDVGGVALIKQGHNKENAKKFIDWVLGADAQNLFPSMPSFVVPTNPKAKIGKDAPRQDKVKHVEWNTRDVANSRDELIRAFNDEVASSKSAK